MRVDGPHEEQQGAASAGPREHGTHATDGDRGEIAYNVDTQPQSTDVRSGYEKSKLWSHRVGAMARATTRTTLSFYQRDREKD